VVESPWTIHFQQCSSESRQVAEELVESWTDRSAPTSALEDNGFESWSRTHWLLGIRQAFVLPQTTCRLGLQADQFC